MAETLENDNTADEISTDCRCDVCYLLCAICLMRHVSARARFGVVLVCAAVCLLSGSRLYAQAAQALGRAHAFCERLLHLFPFEADVPARFEVMDELLAADLLEQARHATLADAMAAPETPVGLAVAIAAALSSVSRSARIGHVIAQGHRAVVQQRSANLTQEIPIQAHALNSVKLLHSREPRDGCYVTTRTQLWGHRESQR